MKATCPIHGVLEVPVGTTTCPVCYTSNQIQTQLNAMESAFQNMQDLDEKIILDVDDNIKKNWKLKRGNALILLPVSSIAILFFLLPSIPTFFNLSTAGNVIIWLLGGFISLIAFLLVSIWLFTLYRKGGILSIQEEKQCQFGFNYYEDPNSRKCGGLISSVKATRSSGLGCLRYGCCQIILTILFLFGIIAGVSTLSS